MLRIFVAGTNNISIVETVRDKDGAHFFNQHDNVFVSATN